MCVCGGLGCVRVQVCKCVWVEVRMCEGAGV